MAAQSGSSRPTREQLSAARDKRVPDIIRPGLRVLFVGINPGLYSGAVGHHFARPGNRFWKALQGGGFTERTLSPARERELLSEGIGISNIVARTTAAASELSPDELKRGAAALERKVERYKPRAVAFLGIGAFRIAYGGPTTPIGPQPETLAGAAVWVLPNPSGLNASYQLPALSTWFRALRRSLDP